MLKIVVPGVEAWDESKEEFVYQEKPVVLQLEHSLVSISKWESKYHKAFLGKQDRTAEETLDYIKFMTVTQNVDDSVYTRLTQQNINDITKYIEDPMTATWFGKTQKKGPSDRRVITSELIYCRMIQHNIPVEFQKWHLNRLITLIKVCDEENQPKKKKTQKESLQEMAAINAVRRAKSKAAKQQKE